MSSSKITTPIHKRLLIIYLYCFLVSIAAAFSLSAKATSAFPISFPQLDSPFEGVALTDVLFANYLNEKTNKNWAEPYMFLPRRDDRLFVYPVIRGNFNEDENTAVSPGLPERASAPDTFEDVPENAPAHDESESDMESSSAHDESESDPESASAYDEPATSPESISIHDESEDEPEDEPEGATALDNSVYRSWLLEQLQRIDLDYFRANVLITNFSHIDDQQLAEMLNSQFHTFSNVLVQGFLRRYLESLTREQLSEWFNHFLKSPPEIFDAFSTNFPRALIEAGLPPLPQETLNILRRNDLFLEVSIRVTLPIILAFLHEQERGISTEENEYYQQLDSGHLPQQQPPQSSFVLTPEDFRDHAVFYRMSGISLLRVTWATLSGTHDALEHLATPEDCYQAYLQFLLSTFLDTPDELIEFAKHLNYLATHSQQRLRNEYGLYYVPSQRWLSPAVEAIRQQAGENPVGLEIAAGSGSLSHFLRSHYNIPMTATDNFSRYHEITKKTKNNLRARVKKADALTAVRNHPKANFLALSWPVFHPMNTEESQRLEAIMSNLRERDDSFYRVVIEHIQADYPFLAAILEWNDRGPILFIGELRPAIHPLSAYLQQHYDAISFRDFYQPLPFASDYPTLFVPKTKDQPDKAAGKGKDKD